MTDYNRTEADMLKRVTRRYMLRNSSIAAAGAILLPSFITGCMKNAPERGVGSGDDQLTPEQLQQAAANLTRMRVWITDLYPLCVEYEAAVFHALATTTAQANWTNFIVDIFIDIAFALAAATAIASDGAAAVPAFAFLSAILHDWGIGKDRPSTLDDEFASFQFGHVRMQLAMEQKLSALIEPTNNYSNLTAAWQDPIEFNGGTYKLANLASSYFPDLGDDYNALQTAAIISFEKALWNLVIMKCCTYSIQSRWTIDMMNDQNDNTYPYHSIVEYAQQTMYPINKGRYLRAVLQYRYDTYSTYELQSWNLGINGASFSDEASSILFMDDTPGHTINRDGLFNRSYVFEQFSITKPTILLGNSPDYPSWHELGHDPKSNFWQDDDWEYTGGIFKKI